MNKITRTIFLLFFTAYFGNAQAAVMTTLSGSTVSYSFEESLLGLFGIPTLSGDNLFFTPQGFSATGNQIFDIKNATINIKVSALNGGTIGAIGLTEKGDYIMKGGTSGVELGGQLRVTDLSSLSTEVTDSIEADASFITGTTFFPTHSWTANAGVDFSSNNSSTVNITIENILLAFSGDFGDLGFIEKKAVILGVSSIPFSQVPLPASVWLFGSALIGFLLITSRRYLTTTRDNYF
jgi:hypothetical protein